MPKRSDRQERSDRFANGIKQFTTLLLFEKRLAGGYRSDRFPSEARGGLTD